MAGLSFRYQMCSLRMQAITDVAFREPHIKSTQTIMLKFLVSILMLLFIKISHMGTIYTLEHHITCNKWLLTGLLYARVFLRRCKTNFSLNLAVNSGVWIYVVAFADVSHYHSQTQPPLTATIKIPNSSTTLLDSTAPALAQDHSDSSRFSLFWCLFVLLTGKVFVFGWRKHIESSKSWVFLSHF